MPARIASFISAVCLGLLLTGQSFSAWAGDDTLRIESRLVWASNNEAPPEGVSAKPVDEKLHKRLRGMFKWRHYHEVEHKELTLAHKKTQKVQFGKDCAVKVTYLGNNQIEAVYGEGDSQVRKRQTLKPGEVFSIGGPRKDDSAWFALFSLKQ
jgi:hypothetical protein